MERKLKILLAEDDLQLGFIIKDNLEEAGYEVINCPDGEIAWNNYQKKSPDICILDVNLPYKDGFSLAKKIRQRSDVMPILFLTAKSLIEDKLKGFAAGGDDYIVKPFNMKELLSRIQVFQRRSGMMFRNAQTKIDIGRYTFLPNELKLVLDDKEIILTSKEKDLLEFLCTHPNVVLKREEILINVWGKNDFFLGRSMDVFIMRLRKYLSTDPNVMIETIHGIGYRFVS
ncbi:MAG TPA: response regulator transcription factor [Chitinophagaceae bacterium]|jgi:DNA-binding response OmpR family regulator|nr:response regulator transcription factor [Chitinophagaceae bacterium]